MSEPALASTTTPRSRAAVRQVWVERLARYPTSGLSPAQFCANEGVSLPSFYCWKRRLSTEKHSPGTEPTGDTPPGPRLLPVRLASTHAVPEFVLPGGTVLRVPPGCDLAFVRSLVEALGEAPC